MTLRPLIGALALSLLLVACGGKDDHAEAGHGHEEEEHGAEEAARAVEMAVSLFVEEPFYVVERNLLTNRQIDGEMYGTTPWDFAVLVSRNPDDALRALLDYFISEVKPAGTNGRVIFFGNNSSLDFFTYLDFNGKVLENVPAVLDAGSALTGISYLQ